MLEQLEHLSNELSAAHLMSDGGFWIVGGVWAPLLTSAEGSGIWGSFWKERRH